MEEPMAALNIKSDETYALVRELAEQTGESMTEAVTTAVRERLARLSLRDGLDDAARARLEEGRKIAHTIASRWGPYDPDEDPTAFLYDEETGLPK
jgi:antitoxin VapB